MTDASKDGTFSAEERAAMKDRAAELRAEKRRGKAEDKRAEDERAVVAAIASMPDADRALAERVHVIVRESAPVLAPRLWYGMPAYARDGTTVCFFQGAAKFTARYATLGFDHAAELDEGTMWPTSFAPTAMTPTEESAIAALVRQAVGR